MTSQLKRGIIYYAERYRDVSSTKIRSMIIKRFADKAWEGCGEVARAIIVRK